MKIDTSKPLAENVHTLLSGLLSRRRNAKVWEGQLMTQAGLELEATDPAETAEKARVGVIYTIGRDIESQHGVLPKGHRLYKDHCGWKYKLSVDPDWKRYSTLVPHDTPIKASAVQEL